MATEQHIGTRIAKRRQQLGMRQEDLADALSVSKSTVANWESGKHFPQRNLGAIEAVLGVNLTDSQNVVSSDEALSPDAPPVAREELRDQLRRIEDLAREVRARLDEEERRDHDKRRRGA